MDPHQQAEQRLLALLGARLSQLVSRRVPVRGVQAGPVLLTTRLLFADGTTLLVRSEHSGDMAQVLHAISMGRPVLVEHWERRPTGLALRLSVRVAGRQRHLGILVLGPDQPD